MLIISNALKKIPFFANGSQCCFYRWNFVKETSLIPVNFVPFFFFFLLIFFFPFILLSRSVSCRIQVSGLSRPYHRFFCKTSNLTKRVVFTQENARLAFFLTTSRMYQLTCYFLLFQCHLDPHFHLL